MRGHEVAEQVDLTAYRLHDVVRQSQGQITTEMVARLRRQAVHASAVVPIGNAGLAVVVTGAVEDRVAAEVSRFQKVVIAGVQVGVSVVVSDDS